MITKLKVSPGNGHQVVYDMVKQNIKWLGLEVLRLNNGESWQGTLNGVECGLIPLSGRMSITISGAKEAHWSGIGSRADIFSGSPWAVYVPRNSDFKVVAESKLELAIAKAPCDRDFPATVIKPEEVKVVSSGVANWRRDVRLIIAPGSAISQRLIVGETVNPPGNWSGIPPHKHDEITGKENFLEEFYWYKVKPANGYGIQLGYKEGIEECYFVRNDDVVLMQNGYHPTVAAPGATLCYLWVLSGDDKVYNIATDPGFDWIAQAEAVFKEVQR